MDNNDIDNNINIPKEEIFDEDELSFLDESSKKLKEDVLDNSKKNPLKDKFKW